MLPIYLTKISITDKKYTVYLLISSGLCKLSIKVYILSICISRCHFLNLKIDCMCCIKSLWQEKGRDSGLGDMERKGNSKVC